jgi:hypothetical protein
VNVMQRDAITVGSELIMVLTAVQVNGSKPRWAAIIAIDFVGPILYFTRGRRPSPS